MIEKEIKYKSDEELLILTFLYKYGLSPIYLHKKFKCIRGKDISLYKYYDIERAKEKDYSCMEIEYIKGFSINVTVHNYRVGICDYGETLVRINRRLLKLLKNGNRKASKYVTMALPIYLKQKDNTFRAINIDEFDYLENVLQKYNNFNGPKYFDDSFYYDTEEEMEEARLLRESFEKEKIEKGFDHLYYDSNFYKRTSVKVIELGKKEVKELEKYFIENKKNIVSKYYNDINSMLESRELFIE